MYCHARYDWWINWAVLVPIFFGRRPLHRKPFYLIQDLPPIQHLSKHGVDVVQMRLAFVRDEKLRSVRVHPRIGHAHDAPLVVHIVGVEFVLKFAAPDRLAALPRARGVAALHHESFHVAMERRAVVIAARAEGEEIEGGALGRVAEHLDFDVSQAAVESDGHVIVGDLLGAWRNDKDSKLAGSAQDCN